MFLPGKSRGQKSLVGYSPWNLKRAGHDLAAKQQKRLEKKCLRRLFKEKDDSEKKSEKCQVRSMKKHVKLPVFHGFSFWGK